jgi:hypothetical protein
MLTAAILAGTIPITLEFSYDAGEAAAYTRCLTRRAGFSSDGRCRALPARRVVCTFQSQLEAREARFASSPAEMPVEPTRLQDATVCRGTRIHAGDGLRG